MASQKSPSNQPSPDENCKVERALYDALRCSGWLIPQTVEDVRRAEAELAAHHVILPSSLRDPAAVFDGGASSPQEDFTIPLVSDVNAEEYLARAAREGGDIPAEIEERMRLDRDAAESEVR
jgi:hypothetical protein